jgi:hypothetical protein
MKKFLRIEEFTISRQGTGDFLVHMRGLLYNGTI